MLRDFLTPYCRTSGANVVKRRRRESRSQETDGHDAVIAAMAEMHASGQGRGVLLQRAEVKIEIMRASAVAVLPTAHQSNLLRLWPRAPKANPVLPSRAPWTARTQEAGRDAPLVPTRSPRSPRLGMSVAICFYEAAPYALLLGREGDHITTPGTVGTRG